MNISLITFAQSWICKLTRLDCHRKDKNYTVLNAKCKYIIFKWNCQTSCCGGKKQITIQKDNTSKVNCMFLIINALVAFEVTKNSSLNWSIDFCSYLCAVPIRILLNSSNGEWKCFWKHTQKLLNKGQIKWKAQCCQKKLQKVNRTFQHFFEVLACTTLFGRNEVLYKIHFPFTPKEEAWTLLYVSQILF